LLKAIGFDPFSQRRRDLLRRYQNFTKTCKEDFRMEFEAYCVKCREKRQIKDGRVEETAKGRKMAKGECPVCGTKVTRFLSGKE
jgi:hypothetical protein